MSVIFLFNVSLKVSIQIACIGILLGSTNNNLDFFIKVSQSSMQLILRHHRVATTLIETIYIYIIIYIYIYIYKPILCQSNTIIVLRTDISAVSGQ